MTEKRLSIPLTVPEVELIHGLRDIPDSPLKSRILVAIEDLVRLGQAPGCADAQADGVPCGCGQSQCETCAGALERVDALIETNLPPWAA
jgi:hypothetical protein